jgi:hypothetical protein
MRRRYLLFLAAGGLLIGGLLLWKLLSQPRQATTLAIGEIEQLGGTVEVDEDQQEKPVVMVNLVGTTADDSALKHLRDFPHLRRLYLGGTAVSDKGLANLKNCLELQELFLFATSITDAGLEHLTDLSDLQTLALNSTKITDAGLLRLKGLTNLRHLYVADTRVTEDGIKAFLDALPDPSSCTVYRYSPY